jgi:xanthine dehydrogenase accessory factor
MRELLHELLTTLEAGRTVAMTQLVETRGSTPQKAGAAMLVFPDGSQQGTLGGGCVEAEVKRRALAVLPTGRPELMTFQLDNDYGWDDGLICGGRMQMLVEPLQPGMDLSYYRALSQALDAGRGCTQAVVFEAGSAGQPLDRYLFNREGACVASSAATEANPPPAVTDGLRSIARRPRPYVVGGVSYLPHPARGKLLIVGGGHVGQKVGDLAADVHFDVTVIDDRAEYVSEERFPSAMRRIAGQIDDVLPQLDVDEDTFCIVVTRGHNHDEQALALLVNRPSRYLGMIGSRRKIKLIFDDLRRQGVTEEALARVHAPLGLEIGSQTVPEIAISIVAELIACRNREIPEPVVR